MRFEDLTVTDMISMFYMTVSVFCFFISIMAVAFGCRLANKYADRKYKKYDFSNKVEARLYMREMHRAFRHYRQDLRKSWRERKGD